MKTKKIEQFIKQHHMFSKGEKLVIGLSGGADSMCLFHVLLAIREAWHLQLIAVHVNHGLRPEEGERDQQFVQQVCEKYQIPLEVILVDVADFARKQKRSVEEAGRILRRKAFCQVCQKYGATRIALAHHQNDNAETLLWNLSRGTSLGGLGGIRPVRGKIVRPLLCMSRREIEELLVGDGVSWCTDTTNEDTTYIRNAIRHKVLPVLTEQVNEQTVRHMYEASRQVQAWQTYIEEQVQAAFCQCVCAEEEGGYSVKAECLQSYPTVFRKELLAFCVAKAAGTRRDITVRHIEAVYGLLDRQTGKCIHLPYGLYALRTYDGLWLGKVPQKKTERLPACLLCVPGRTTCVEGKWEIYCRIFQRESVLPNRERGKKTTNIHEKVYTEQVDYDIIKGELCFRTRQQGDRLSVDRAGHTQKLKDWFINQKILQRNRDEIPVIAEGSQIVWVVGYRVGSRYAVSENTRQILQIEIRQWTNGAEE